ncbi:MBL fold metallo-hydrolase [Halioglobus maricola]|uniref:MBL fold metallo-hydrolase n=1 Tax=Halioglobus maricola TaxID=2601894 RepID=A0A5P9NKK8_9GAMM|nr:MBL fold metallo-hydrolase [Halioglobus maricola]QFU76026.1 MBL fold metallo-hydrolase [Halioglobus maricola]
MLTYPHDTPPEHGTLREVAPGIHWLQMPLPMALDHINLYMLEDDDGWWIVDSGMALGPTEELWEKIFAQHLGGKPIKAVIATHWHPDHTGMAGWLCDRWRVPFYATQGEYLTGLVYTRAAPEHFGWTNEQHQIRSGRGEEGVAASRKSMGGAGRITRPLPTSYQRLEEGSRFTINGQRWRVVVGSGHSPEHACLYCESLNVLISGDQVIPRITSNISVSGIEPEGNPLREWLQSHERFLEVLPDDALVLPAHNLPFYGLHHRLRHLIEHHEDHLIALEEACLQASCTAVELLPVLFKRELDDNQIGLALGECVAHLNYLLHRGQIARTVDSEGCYRYRSVDDTLPMRLRKRNHEADVEVPFQV